MEGVAQQIGTYPITFRASRWVVVVGHNQEEFEVAQVGISPVSQILIDKSLLGWKEYEWK